jgi:glycosyltransferase involved in cell wall biosynthesis
MICASEKQRDLWLGQLSSQGRLNSATYRSDPSLRNLIDVVPFGVDAAPAAQVEHGIRGVVDGISADDRVLIWGGGIYDWFDPLTLIRAVGVLAERHDDVRLFFLSLGHANAEIGRMRMADDAVALATELGLLGRCVFFNERWVEHDRRADYLLDADLGVSTHLDHLETAFSFRTRLLDYAWAGLPIVNTSGDAFEPLITEHGLGAVVPPGDVEALATAIEGLLYDPALLSATAERVRRFAPELAWQRALGPLVEYCRAPYPAADDPRGHGKVAMDDAAAAELRRELEAYRSSTSWRLTAPLRALSRAVGRLRRR